MCVTQTCGVQGGHRPGCRTIYETITEDTCELTYETECKASTETVYETVCDEPPEPKCPEYRGRKLCAPVGPNCAQVPLQKVTDECREVPKAVPVNKHCEILVSCSDKERNCIQAHRTACKLMILCVNSWNCMQAYVTACNLM